MTVTSLISAGCIATDFCFELALSICIQDATHHRRDSSQASAGPPD